MPAQRKTPRGLGDGLGDGLQGPQSLRFEVKPSTVQGAGRGVFAKRRFQAGDIVMQAPILLHDASDVKPGTTISQYHGVHGQRAFLCFDYQGLVNAANDPRENNVRAQWRLQDAISQFVALRDIAAGEELLQGYAQPTRLN